MSMSLNASKVNAGIGSILKRVDVVDPGEHSEFASRNLEVFYTGLYRALMVSLILSRVYFPFTSTHSTSFPAASTRWTRMDRRCTTAPMTPTPSPEALPGRVCW